MSFLLKDRIAMKKKAAAIEEAASKAQEAVAPVEAKASSSSSVEEDIADVVATAATAAPIEQESPLARMRRIAAGKATVAEAKPQAEKAATSLVNASSEAVNEAKEDTTDAPAPKPLTLAEKIALRNKAKAAAGSQADSEAPEASIKQSTPASVPPMEDKSAPAVNAPEQEKQPEPATKPTPEVPERKLTLREKIALRKQQEANEAIAAAEVHNKSSSNFQLEHTDTVGAEQVKNITQANEVAVNLADNRKAVTLNERQRMAVDLAKRGSMVLIGKAGTGKTTSVREIIKWLITPKEEGGYGIPFTADFKKQNGGGTKDRTQGNPRIVVASFTKRAVTNIKNSCIQAMPELKVAEWCFQSLHNAAEYAPEYYEDVDDEGNTVNKMRFAPQKWEGNKIDADYFIVEEASMVGLELWARIIAALPDDCVIIFLGDISQLPPVFGLPILIYAMAKLPVVELSEVYRTKMGPVLNGAHNILEGKMPEFAEADTGSLRLYMPWQNAAGKPTLRNVCKDVPGNEVTFGPAKLAAIYEKLFHAMHDKGDYDPEQDMILTPFNKHELGSIYLNKCIAQFIGAKRNAEVHEILSGYEKHYLAVGDKVMVDKQDGVITNIMPNHTYMGSMPQPSGTDLTRFGIRIIGGSNGSTASTDDFDLDDYANFSLEALAEIGDDDAAKHAASHIVEVTMETGQVLTLSKKGDFNGDKFSLGYVLTGHKAQGSEFRNVYVIMHKTHHTLISREWLYTVMTRTKETCTLLCNPYSIEQAMKTQRITGNTIEEKLAWFLQGVTDMEEVVVCPSERLRAAS